MLADTMSQDQRNDPAATARPPGVGRTFRISAASLRQRNRNTAAGLLFAVALCLIVGRALLNSDDTYYKTLLGAVILTVILLGLIQFTGHVRLLRKSRRHQIVVGEDRIYFRTGEDQTILILADVLLVERQRRIREGPSLMMRLRNGRFVRLEGYEQQEQLTELVAERFGAAEGRSRPA